MKKKNLFYVLIACIICLLVALTGCNDNTGNTPGGNEDTGTYYTVTFDSRGGSAVESQRIREGNPVRSPEVPKRENYFFLGWYKSIDDNAVEWKFATDTVTSDITLYAKWQSNQAQIATDSLTYEQKGNGYVVTGASGQEERIIIPAQHEGLPVTEIGESAFAYSKHTSDITYVSIPDSVTAIGLNAFHNRSELVTVDISGDSALTAIGRNAFSGNSSLKAIYIPQGVKEIGDSAFNNCGLLDNISVATANTAYSGEGNNLIEKATNTLIRGSNKSVIPSSVTTIAQAAFRRANGITELYIPVPITTIGNFFIADSTITKINYAGTEAEWNAIEKSATMWNYGNRKVQLAFSSASVTPSEPVNLCEVYMTFGNETVTAQLYDNATARDLVARLPLTLSFSDFNGTEKIAYLPSGSSELDTSDAPATFTPAAGDITVYIPWGNIAIFYNVFRSSSGLAPFGKIGSQGIAKLSQISDNTNITITREKPTVSEHPTDEQKVLVAYFSATGTTEGVAEAIHNQIAGSYLYEIVPQVPYTEDDLKYYTDCRADREQADSTARPAISGSVENIEQYDVIFIGYPIWHGQAPKIIYTFLESYEFSEKTIIPFCTSASSSMGSSATNLHSLAPQAIWKSGARISGNNVGFLIAQMN